MLTKVRPVIGVAGRAKVGKDAVAQFLLGAKVSTYQYSFADPLRGMLLSGFGIDLRSPYWQARKEEAIPAFGKSPRQMLQTLGTEWGRTLVKQDVWILLAQQKLINAGPGMVVSDVRFEDEAAWVRKMGGTVVHVVRNSAVLVHPHSSERGVARDPRDKVIHNNGSLEELQSSVLELFS